jgi:hypothetical protein
MPNVTHIDSENVKSSDIYGKVKVFINGAWVGISENPQELYEMLKDKMLSISKHTPQHLWPNWIR